MRKTNPILVLLVSIFGGCAKLDSTKSDATAQTGEPTREAATLSQQAMCTAQAKKSFERSSFSDDKYLLHGS
jgi:hypothetical protein